MTDIIKKVRSFITLDFHFNLSNIPVLVVLLLLYPAVLLLPEKCGYENELIENYQLMILFFGCFLWTLVPKYRHLFIFAALIFFAMALREVNTGRALFYAVPGKPNEFYGWDHVWYAPYRLPAGIIFALICAVYFFTAKIYRQIFDLLETTKIPVWNIVLILICWIGADVLDKVCDNLILEEGVELAAYVAIFMTSVLYAFAPIKVSHCG
ncbi:MAG: hypothetical protein E7043_07575 [Lentisphaerae bacterium]|nr:hypothetical protein [Lentisphaerota bacterium]